MSGKNIDEFAHSLPVKVSSEMATLIEQRINGIINFDKKDAGVDLLPGTTDQAIPEGKFRGVVADGEVEGDADLTAANIKTGIDIFGVTGTYDTEAGAPIAAETVLEDQIGFVNGNKITGTMPDVSADIVPDGTAIAIPAGYHDGTKHVTADSNLVAGKIQDGVTIYGVEGTFSDDATAAAGDILKDATAYGVGTKITGTLELTGDAEVGDVLDGSFFYKDDAKTKLEGTLALIGDAVVANVLDGKFFYKDDAKTKLEGAMPNNAGDVAAVSGHMGVGTTLHVVPAAGYTDGADDASTIDLTTVDADLVTGNIKASINILGVAGKTEVVDTTEAGAPIAVETVLVNKVGFVNGSKITGTMPNRTGDTANIGIVAIGTTTIKLLASAGYRDGAAGYVTATDAFLLAGNIKKDVVIFGVTGTYEA